MQRSFRMAHLVVGAVVVVAFLISGQIMLRHEPPVEAMEWAERLLFRSRHIYLLCAGLVNLAIGVHYLLPERTARRAAAGLHQQPRTVRAVRRRGALHARQPAPQCEEPRMNPDPIWLPCIALVGVTALVWFKLYADRLGEMRARRIDPQAVATARDAAGRLERTQAAENFRNLFEVPVLFYLLCVAIAVNGGSTPGFVAAAWVYVALRALHSLIHVSYNRVVHRFLVYVASTLLLFGMWAAFLAGLAVTRD